MTGLCEPHSGNSVALSPVTNSSGKMRISPGSQKPLITFQGGVIKRASPLSPKTLKRKNKNMALPGTYKSCWQLISPALDSILQ